MAKQGLDRARSGALRLLAGVRDGLSLSDQAGALKALLAASLLLNVAVILGAALSSRRRARAAAAPDDAEPPPVAPR